MLASIALAFFLEAAPPAPTLRLLTEENPPYTYFDKQTGEIKGVAATIVREMMRRADIPYTLDLYPWLRAFQTTLHTPATCTFIMDQTPDRQDQFVWVPRLMESSWNFYKRPGTEIEITSLLDLGPYFIVGRQGYASAEALVASGHEKTLLASTNLDAINLLYHGRADLWLVGDYEMPYLAKRANLPEPEFVYRFSGVDSSMGCNRDTDPEIMERLRAANASMEEFKAALKAAPPAH